MRNPIENAIGPNRVFDNTVKKVGRSTDSFKYFFKKKLICEIHIHVEMNSHKKMVCRRPM
jgi:gamma-glutamyl:cysteine ligase YbdK (ATP-grasp superfamily)